MMFSTCTGVELFRHSTGCLNFPRDQLAEIFQVHMSGYELGEGIHCGDAGFAQMAILHAVARHKARAPTMLRPAVDC